MYGIPSDDATPLEPLVVWGERLPPLEATKLDLEVRSHITETRQKNFSYLQDLRRYHEFWNAVEMQAIGADPAPARLSGADFANPANWGAPDWDQRYAAAAQPLYDTDGGGRAAPKRRCGAKLCRSRSLWDCHSVWSRSERPAGVARRSGRPSCGCLASARPELLSRHNCGALNIEELRFLGALCFFLALRAAPFFR